MRLRITVLTIMVVCAVCNTSWAERGTTNSLQNDHDVVGKDSATNDLTVLKIEGTLLGITVTVAIFTAGVALSTKRSLNSAVKSESSKIIGDMKTVFAKDLDECSQKASESARWAYISAMEAIQAFFRSIDMTNVGEMSESVKETKTRLMVAGSLLEIQFGDSDEVITGANNVCQLAPTGAARAALSEGLKRNDLSEEASKTIRSRLKELEKQGIKKR